MAFAAIKESDIDDDVARPQGPQHRSTPCGVFDASAAQAGRLESVHGGPSIDDYRRRVRDRYHAEFGPLALSRCKDQSIADAAINDAFAEAFESLSACGNPARFREWFREILLRKCQERARHRPTRPLRVGEMKKIDT